MAVAVARGLGQSVIDASLDHELAGLVGELDGLLLRPLEVTVAIDHDPDRDHRHDEEDGQNGPSEAADGLEDVERAGTYGLGLHGILLTNNETDLDPIDDVDR